MLQPPCLQRLGPSLASSVLFSTANENHSPLGLHLLPHSGVRACDPTTIATCCCQTTLGTGQCKGPHCPHCPQAPWMRSQLILLLGSTPVISSTMGCSPEARAHGASLGSQPCPRSACSPLSSPN